MDFSLLKSLCSIHAPSGNEEAMTRFLLEYIFTHQKEWKFQPQIFYGNGFQNCIVLVFGRPRTAVFAHIDNIGFTVRYNNGLVTIGSPHAKSGTLLYTTDNGTNAECKLAKDADDHLFIKSKTELARGTTLSFSSNWREDNKSIQCCYMDNRAGVFTALKLCETIRDGAIVFSSWEEHGGGSVSFLTKFLSDIYKIRQTLICDITWATEGVKPGLGVAISMRDNGIPRKNYVDRIVALAVKSGIPLQLEVEGSGGSDGLEIQKQPYPIDWCFVGAPEEHVHTPDEKVDKGDLEGMVKLYEFLMERL